MTAANVSTAELSADPHPWLHRLRSESPVAWIDSLEAWLVTSHALCVDVMLDPETFTVDDPRFSTSQVIGPSMLSLDGLDHRRHRDPFAGPFRATRIKTLRDEITGEADRLVGAVADSGGGDLRSQVAGPLAVAVMTRMLDLAAVETTEVLRWYEEIVAAVHTVTEGGEVPASGLAAFEDLKRAVGANLSSSSLLAPVDESGALSVDEIVSNVAVLLFGGVVTSESSTAIAFRYLFESPDLIDRLRDDSGLVASFVEETLRLEPSAAAVDRYATRDADLGGVRVRRGDLVRVSLGGANRDPDVFAEPDLLRLGRDNIGKSVTFARGPHSCLGIHLARLESVVAVEALLGHPGIFVADDSDPVTGLVFRVPETVNTIWRETDTLVK